MSLECLTLTAGPETDAVPERRCVSVCVFSWFCRCVSAVCVSGSSEFSWFCRCVSAVCVSAVCVSAVCMSAVCVSAVRESVSEFSWFCRCRWRRDWQLSVSTRRPPRPCSEHTRRDERHTLWPTHTHCLQYWCLASWHTEQTRSSLQNDHNIDH